MDIQCPHCNANNEIKFAENICCYKCSKSFAGISFKKYKRRTVGTMMAIFIGGVGGQWIDKNYFEASRYSVGAIYEIVNYCANPEDTFMTEAKQRRLAELCICALHNSMGVVPESELKKRSSEFIKIFNRNMNTCQ